MSYMISFELITLHNVKFYDFVYDINIILNIEADRVTDLKIFSRWFCYIEVHRVYERQIFEYVSVYKINSFSSDVDQLH